LRWLAEEPAGEAADGRREQDAECDVIRCLFENPSRPVATLGPTVLSWNGGVLVSLARAAYQHRQLPGGTLEGDRLAVLADALEEAGCCDPVLLLYCPPRLSVGGDRRRNVPVVAAACPVAGLGVGQGGTPGRQRRRRSSSQ
jgi:hypothetical protein